jgi:hypothetical protein
MKFCHEVQEVGNRTYRRYVELGQFVHKRQAGSHDSSDASFQIPRNPTGTVEPYLFPKPNATAKESSTVEIKAQFVRF